MRNVLIVAAALSVVALGATARAQPLPPSACLSGTSVLVHYLVPDPLPDDLLNHTNKHIIWAIQGQTPIPTATPGSRQGPAEPRAVAIADFFADGNCEILWEDRNQVSPPVLIRLALTNELSEPDPRAFDEGEDRPSPSWRIAGTSDFTGDGAADLLWWNQQTSEAMLWSARPEGGWKQSSVSGVPVPANAPLPLEIWRPVGAARLEQNSEPGVLFQDGPPGSQVLRFYPAHWTGSALELQQGQEIPGLALSEWAVVAVGDFDGNGYEDLLRQNLGSGQLAETLQICFLEAGSSTTCTTLNPDRLRDTVFPTAPWTVIGPR